MKLNRQYCIPDYSNESLDKELDSDSLVEAIHEYLEPRNSHNDEYLLKRIQILREFFNLLDINKNENVLTIDALLHGYGEIQDLKLLPFDDALELPSTIDTLAHQSISDQYREQIQDIRDKSYEIHREYINYRNQNSQLNYSIIFQK